MDEGEFQKRILKKAEQDGSESNPSGTDWHDTINVDDVSKVIEEAKKDFQEKFYTGKEISFEHKTKQELFNYIIRKNQERDNWFKKWFGDNGKAT